MNTRTRHGTPSLWRRSALVSIIATGSTLLAACSQSEDAREHWRVVEVSGPGASSESSSLAAGTAVAIEEDALVLSRRDTQVRLLGKVTRRADGSATILLSDGALVGREVRWEAVDGQKARLIWPNKLGNAVMELEKVSR